MKNIFCILALISMTVMLNAQDFSINVKSTYGTYTGVATDVVDTIESISKVVDVNRGYLYYYDVLIDIDTLSGGGGEAVTVALSGSNDNVNYTSITSLTYAASADTIIRLNNLSGTTQTIASYTITSNLVDTTSAYNIITDTTGLSGYPADTMAVPQVTSTTEGTQTVAAQTITFNQGGIMWNYLKVTLTGTTANSYVELQAIKVKVVEIP